MPYRTLVIVAALAMLSGLASAAEPGDARTGEAASTASGRADPLTLLATGKEAVARYTEDPTLNAGAIVDAAVAFELAQRATSAWTDPTIANEIQSSLFWCRKQMDATALQQYRARLDALPPPRSAGKTATAAKPSRPAAKPVTAPALQTARPVDPLVLAGWVQRLQERIRADITAHREPHFTLTSMKSAAILRGLAADGTMTLAVDGGEITYPWRLVTMQDLASIATGLPTAGDQGSYALAAFFQFAAGDEAAARDNMLRAGALAAEVERSFQATAKR